LKVQPSRGYQNSVQRENQNGGDIMKKLNLNPQVFQEAQSGDFSLQDVIAGLLNMLALPTLTKTSSFLNFQTPPKRFCRC